MYGILILIVWPRIHSLWPCYWLEFFYSLILLKQDLNIFFKLDNFVEDIFLQLSCYQRQWIDCRSVAGCLECHSNKPLLKKSDFVCKNSEFQIKLPCTRTLFGSVMLLLIDDPHPTLESPHEAVWWINGHCRLLSAWKTILGKISAVC